MLLLAQQSISGMMWMAPLAAFACIAVVAYVLAEQFSGKDKSIEDRLDDFRDPAARRQRERNKRGESTVSRVLTNTAVAMSKPLQPKSETEVNAVRDKLSHAGFRSENAPFVFWGAKFAGLIFGFMVAGGVYAFAGISGIMGLVKAMAPIGLLFFGPDILIWWMGKSRKQSIFLGLPDALDLLVVCVEAGLGLDQAMRKVTEEMKKAHPVIAEEFGLCNLHLQMGRPRTQVLQDLGNRNGVEDLRTLASIMIQADKFGSSIAQALRTQSEAMRTRRRQIAEEKAQQTAVKLIFPLVLFIFPGIFVVLVGPAAITMVREMFPAMSKGG